MAGSDFYRTGKGIFGGRYGSYGRYGVGQAASNLSAQFGSAENVENTQRRRFGRKRESGYSGAGFWFSNYPNMVGAMTAGTDPREGNISNKKKPLNKSNKTTTTSNGLGNGGTAAGYIGGLGS